MPKKRHWFFDPARYHVRVGERSEYPDGHVIKTHSHPWHQLTYASQGVITVRTSDGAWVTPTHRGVWVTAGTRHSVQMSGAVLLRALYFAPAVSASLPGQCCVLEISPLLRELILRIFELGGLNWRIAEQAHLIHVLMDQVRAMRSDPIHLPAPRDPRARRIVSLLQEDPSERRPLGELSKIAGASKRTLERLFKTETGLGFGRWRQQFRLGHALRLLAAGEPVTNVALDVGYRGASAFIAAFRRTFAQTPGGYYARRER